MTPRHLLGAALLLATGACSSSIPADSGEPGDEADVTQRHADAGGSVAHVDTDAGSGETEPTPVKPPPADAGSDACAGDCVRTLRVRAYIDGQTALVMKGSSLHWHNTQGAAPGRWQGANEPTSLDGVAWMPVWPQSGENRDCNCDSQDAPKLAPLGAHAQTVGLSLVHARGKVTVDQPSASNGFTARVNFADSTSGADWYEIVLTYAQ